jgi:hypothetical protein
MCVNYADAAINGAQAVRVAALMAANFQGNINAGQVTGSASIEKSIHCNRYIDAAINGGPSMQQVPHSRLPAFKATVMDAMPQLVELDSSAIAGIIHSSFPQEHAAAVRQLQGSPQLQYRYLKAALQVRSLLPCNRILTERCLSESNPTSGHHCGTPNLLDHLCTQRLRSKRAVRLSQSKSLFRLQQGYGPSMQGIAFALCMAAPRLSSGCFLPFISCIPAGDCSYAQVILTLLLPLISCVPAGDGSKAGARHGQPQQGGRGGGRGGRA